MILNNLLTLNHVNTMLKIYVTIITTPTIQEYMNANTMPPTIPMEVIIVSEIIVKET